MVNGRENFMKKLKIFIIIEFCFILFFSPVAALLFPDKEFSDIGEQGTGTETHIFREIIFRWQIPGQL